MLIKVHIFLTAKNNRVHKNKKLFNIYDVDISKILISKKEPYGKKTH